MFDWLFGTSNPRLAILRHPNGTFEAVKYNRYGEDYSIDESGEVMVPIHLRSTCSTEAEARRRIDAYKMKPVTETIWQERAT